MKTIEYDSKNGIPIPDGMAEEAARNFLKGHNADDFLVVSTSNVIDAARALIAEDEFSYDQVIFKFGNQYLAPDKFGALPSWPLGFCDHTMKMLSRIVKRRMKVL